VFYRAGGKFMSARITWQGAAATVNWFEDVRERMNVAKRR
jgi:hypothetical protein